YPGALVSGRGKKAAPRTAPEVLAGLEGAATLPACAGPLPPGLGAEVPGCARAGSRSARRLLSAAARASRSARLAAPPAVRRCGRQPYSLEERREGPQPRCRGGAGLTRADESREGGQKLGLGSDLESQLVLCNVGQKTLIFPGWNNLRGGCLRCRSGIALPLGWQWKSCMPGFVVRTRAASVCVHCWVEFEPYLVNAA
ncbi:hypothetical protein MC885_019821, partial [Smutsia gigantea]